MGNEDGNSGNTDYHEHEMEECAEFSGRHKQYIRENIKLLKQRCKEFKVCLNDLYSKENVHLILQGGDIDLKLMCGFLYHESQNATTTESKCTAPERLSIKDDVSAKFDEAINLGGEEDKEDMKEIKDCIHNSTHNPEQRTNHLDHVCGIAAQKETDVVCTSRVHHHIERFLNHQLEHIQCTCNSLRQVSPRFPYRYRLAIGGGGLAFLILLIVFIVCMCKRRKRNKRKKLLQQETLRRVDYHISRGSDIDDTYTVCQDPKYSIAGRAGSGPIKPPELPPRYTKYPSEEKDPTFDYLLPADLPEDSPVPNNKMSDRRCLTSPDGASIEDITEKGVRRPRPGYDPLGPRNEGEGYTQAVHMPVADTADPKNTYFLLESESLGERPPS